MIYALLFSGKGDSVDFVTPMVFTDKEHFDNFVKYEFNPGSVKHWNRLVPALTGKVSECNRILPALTGTQIDLTAIANGEEG